MAETQENNIGLLTKLALLSDAVDNIFPNGKKMVAFELRQDEFDSAKKELLVPNIDSDQFKIDMSGIEFIFLKDGLLNASEDKI